MDITGSVALVTGANRGLGKSLCASLLERGAAKVYAGARDISSVTMDGVEPILLDITSTADIEAAALQVWRRDTARQQRGHRHRHVGPG